MGSGCLLSSRGEVDTSGLQNASCHLFPPRRTFICSSKCFREMCLVFDKSVLCMSSNLEIGALSGLLLLCAGRLVDRSMLIALTFCIHSVWEERFILHWWGHLFLMRNLMGSGALNTEHVRTFVAVSSFRSLSLPFRRRPVVVGLDAKLHLIVISVW